MKRIVLATTLFMFFGVDRAEAFIFTDLIAKIQRIEMIRQAGEFIGQIDTYRKEFDKYKLQFDKYYTSFHTVYRKLDFRQWPAFDPSSWSHFTDHVITFWKTFDMGAWQSQVVALRTSPFYSANTDYRQYADNLISLSEQQIARLKQEEAHLIDLERQDAAHQNDLIKFRAKNSELAVGSDKVGDEIQLSQQIALTNAILIELATIQAETKIVEQRLLTDQKEERNLIMKMKQLEIEAQQGDLRNLDLLRAQTRAK